MKLLIFNNHNRFIRFSCCPKKRTSANISGTWHNAEVKRNPLTPFKCSSSKLQEPRKKKENMQKHKDHIQSCSPTVLQPASPYIQCYFQTYSLHGGQLSTTAVGYWQLFEQHLIHARCQIQQRNKMLHSPSLGNWIKPRILLWGPQIPACPSFLPQYDQIPSSMSVWT